ncbi:heavy metal translocating P-type ATPase [Myxococcus sp. CA056]|uniref:heavy metal translocating P-type ATPase n=1 Tax=Myxococcus sp. CA056 TaxID=2741740 RepID=UPI00157AA697|nr:heavy metal translocating P-type ATPase [Myxococcus sp. CA056]NTX15687.1 heavy metal translocating P-type ATPase [Myxococcus sp. CA056]
MSEQKKTDAQADHVHGPDCKHDHGHGHGPSLAAVKPAAAKPVLKGLKIIGPKREEKHVHGPGCTHDHAAHGGDAHQHGRDAAHGADAHQHGPDCKHDHAHGGDAHQHGHDHAHGGDAHQHGPGCSHDHGQAAAHEHGAGCDHDHGDHGHHHHHPKPKRVRPPGYRSAEGGGVALQLDLEDALPGETDDAGRFQKLEAALEAHHGVIDVHLRRDQGYAEVCLHYNPGLVNAAALLATVKRTGEQVAKRYKSHTWFVRGMSSADSATAIEHGLGKLPGVLSANVAYASERLVVEYDSEDISLKGIETGAKKLGYTLEVPSHGHACSHHAHGGGLAPLLEMPLVVASGVLLVAGWLLERFAPVPALVPTIVWALSILSGGFFAIRGSVKSLLQLRIDIETMMVVAALGAAVLGSWFEGAFLLFLFSAGHALEHRAMDRARRSIESLGALRPEVARVRRGGELVEVPVAQVLRGDRVVVRPGDRVPLDGIIREGKSSLEQAAITGESMPVPKKPGDEVFSGTVNCEALLEVEVTRLSSESVLARVVDMVAEAEAQKGPNQRFAQRLERTFAPLVMIGAVVFPVVLVLMGMPLKEAILRAVSLLVAASPCALAISTPSAVLSAVAAAARGGVLIKGGIYLELLGKVNAMAFDKTGTLTVGKPKLLSTAPVQGVTDEELLGTAAAVEALSAHPLAHAVVEAASARGIQAPAGSDMEAIHGKGLRAKVGDALVDVGSLALFEGDTVPADIKAQVDRLEEAGQTTMVVRKAGRYLGVLGVADTVRAGARHVIETLKQQGITRTVMLSGDNARVAKSIAAQVGLDEARAPMMPADKVTAVREMGRQGSVAMVGDGVNDAPALAAAAVGVAMGGAGSDAALETADVVLMSDDLSRLPFVLGLARQATAVMKQNLVIALGISAILIIATLFGLTQISHAVVLHEGSTLLVVANGLRLLAVRPKVMGSTPLPSMGIQPAAR